MKEKTDKAFDSCTFIINPSRLPEYAKMLKRILKRIAVPKVIESQSRDHFIESVAEFCRSDHRYLLVWGGDGTAHDAVDTFVQEMGEKPEIRWRKAMGFLRGGSGNGIQDSYEVPLRLRKQVQTYAESMRNGYMVDVDLLETSHGKRTSYCQLVGFGFDAHVLRKRASNVYRFGPQKGAVRRGAANYFLSVMSTFLLDFNRIPHPFHLRMHDGKYSFKGTRVNAELAIDYAERKTNAIEIEVGSRPYYGRLFKICPDVVCNDGYLDLYIYDLQSRMSVLQNIVWLWTGRHDRINKKFAKDRKPLIERYEVDRVEIASREPFEYHIDGELVRTDTMTDGEYRVNIRVVPRRLTFLVPGAFYRKFHPFDGSFTEREDSAET